MQTVVSLTDRGLELATGILAPRVVASSPDTVYVALLATTATLLGGDHVRLHLSIDTQRRLEIHDVAGTVAYDGRGAAARWDVTVSVGPGADLVWHGEPLVVSDGADVRRTLHAGVAAGGRLLMRDTVALGRAGQAGGRLSCRTRIEYAGRPALVEDLALGDPSLDVLSGRRVVETVTAVGWRPPAETDTFELAVPGAVDRSLLDDAHTSTQAATWSRWLAAMGGCGLPGRLVTGGSRYGPSGTSQG